MHYNRRTRLRMINWLDEGAAAFEQGFPIEPNKYTAVMASYFWRMGWQARTFEQAFAYWQRRVERKPKDEQDPIS